jgi:hypothetical protein
MRKRQVRRRPKIMDETHPPWMRDSWEMGRTPPSEPAREQRVRRPGAGRKRLTEKDPTLVPDLESLVEPTTRGDPQSPLRWTCKSVRKLADELRAMGHAVGPQKVSELLHELEYSLQGTRKTREGSSHPDRNAQFEYINAQARSFRRAGEPAISVDTKKKELVGDFTNRGQEWRPAGDPVPVRVHDFIDERLGKAIPYGVSDVRRNEGWVNVGIDHDTAEFAVDSIRRWWRRMGKRAYPAHHAELARTSARERRDNRQPDRKHHHLDRTAHQGGARRRKVRESDPCLRRRDGKLEHRTASISRRLELCHPRSTLMTSNRLGNSRTTPKRAQDPADPRARRGPRRALGVPAHPLARLQPHRARVVKAEGVASKSGGTNRPQADPHPSLGIAGNHRRRCAWVGFTLRLRRSM